MASVQGVACISSSTRACVAYTTSTICKHLQRIDQAKVQGPALHAEAAQATFKGLMLLYPVKLVGGAPVDGAFPHGLEHPPRCMLPGQLVLHSHTSCSSLRVSVYALRS